MKAKKVSQSFTVMTEMIMPNDTNPMGNLMGGNLLRWMDIASAIAAARHAEAQVVTVSVDTVSFKKAIKVGEVITIEASVTRAFRTSIEVFVEVFAAGIDGHNPRHCNSAYFSFVAVNVETEEPIPVPPIVALTESEQQRYDSAPKRREMRMILAGRLKPEDATDLKALFVEG